MAKLGKSFVADEELLQEGEAARCAIYGRLQEYDVNGLAARPKLVHWKDSPASPQAVLERVSSTGST